MIPKRVYQCQMLAKEWLVAQSRQCTKFLSLVVRIGTPHPLTRRRVCTPPPLGGGGGGSVGKPQRVRGGGPHSNEGKDTVVL